MYTRSELVHRQQNPNNAIIMFSRLAQSSTLAIKPVWRSATAKFVPAVVSSATNNTRFLYRQCSTTKDKTATDSKEEGTASSAAKIEGETDTVDAGETVEATPVDNTAEKIAAYEKEIKGLKDQLLRSYAEEENVRRIARRDVDNAKAYANSSFAKSMLEVADDLERGLSVIPVEKRTAADTDPMLVSLIEGLEMTEKNLQKIFAKYKVVKYGQVDEIFNPELHDALFQVPDPTKPNGTIAQIIKCGYKLNDRVIRPAEVGTRSGGPDPVKPDAEETKKK